MLIELSVSLDRWANIRFSFYLSADPCESQAQKGHLTSKLKCRRFPSYLLCTHLLFSFQLFPSQCTLLDFPSISSLASLSFLPCCHRTTTTSFFLRFSLFLSTFSFFLRFLYLYGFFSFFLRFLSLYSSSLRGTMMHVWARRISGAVGETFDHLSRRIARILQRIFARILPSHILPHKHSPTNSATFSAVC